jgi:hypothetical protein
MAPRYHHQSNPLRPQPDGERILANKVEERMIRNDDGAFAPLVEGSTREVATIITHAGIVKTQRWSFSLP